MDLSWNRFPRLKHREVFNLSEGFVSLPRTESFCLPYGNGRSYGDVCLNENGVLLNTRKLNHFIDFDQTTGRLRCEAGVLLKEILELVVPKNWFLPVTPGTQFITIGGAIANDVHGKNHHCAGSFGNHVIRLELLRSDGQRIVCSMEKAKDWFTATIGGLGLTGLITWAEIQLIPVNNPWILAQSRRFSSLDEFWEINSEAEHRWPYTVSWYDCLSAGRGQGRGVYISGQHAAETDKFPPRHPKSLRFPFDPSFSLINPVSLRLINTVYYHKPIKDMPALSHYEPFFYPLDGVLDWNRIYGKKGFFQYQCILPPEDAQDGIKAMSKKIAASGQGSFLAVLKTFGNIPSRGLMSFARPGVTLALDFPNHGQTTLRLFKELDAIVSEAQGVLNPSKDARMSAKMFKSGFPRWEHFADFIDPKFSSSFWRRVTQ
ncbi:FAD/FMN-dependent dehydrogenase [Desulfosporosinus acidiphilus SJ4]|uniref:FAD/FMN-dependent dehydrogenase n=1 Tax=Desulfosporosinus acidiphilus (strain DSM 22704 / JCM 16185 / SJ4) TaxID=646529 RepID=I4DB72_DESAJ|nr:FAD-binding oxidoreductase [Desulfosporosinus acidiphilus]AFM43046.1 FAD/FMN-dependent dehydrogenase [Desulfosporosinus acidiphilus SJ4]